MSASFLASFRLYFSPRFHGLHLYLIQQYLEASIQNLGACFPITSMKAVVFTHIPFFFFFFRGKHSFTDMRLDPGTSHAHTPFTIESGLNGTLLF